MEEQKDIKKNEQQQDAELDESDYLKEDFTIYIPKKRGSEEKKTAS